MRPRLEQLPQRLRMNRCRQDGSRLTHDSAEAQPATTAGSSASACAAYQAQTRRLGSTEGASSAPSTWRTSICAVRRSARCVPPKQQRRTVDILVWRPLALALRSGKTPPANPAPVPSKHGANVVDAHMRRRFDVNDAVWREGETEARPAASVPRHLDLHGVAVFPGANAPGIPSESQCAGDPPRPSLSSAPNAPIERRRLDGLTLRP